MCWNFRERTSKLMGLKFIKLSHFKGGCLDALCNLVPFIQFEKREKHPLRNIAVTIVAQIY